MTCFAENRESRLAEAAAYLRDNGALRAAVGVGDGSVLEPHYLGVGEHNLNFRFDNPEDGCAYVLRVNVAKQPFHDDQVGYEFAALRALEPSGRVPRAVYLDNGPKAPGEGALVESFCEGDMLDFDNLRPGDLRCAAQIMADFHAVPVPPDCALFRPRDPLRSLFEECLRRYREYRESAFEDARVTKWAEAFIAAAEPATHTSVSPAACAHIVNTETLPSHFLIPASSAAAEPADAPGSAGDVGTRSGPFCDTPGCFVDWERPIVGEVAQDVAYFVSPTTTFWDSDFMFPAGDIDAFVDDYWRAVDGRFERGGFDERFRAWRMMTALRSTTWCCRALVTYSRADAHKTERTVRKLPAYLGDEFLSRLASEVFGL